MASNNVNETISIKFELASTDYRENLIARHLSDT